MQFFKKKGTIIAFVLSLASLVLYLIAPAITVETLGMSESTSVLSILTDGEFIFMLFLTIVLIVFSLILILLAKKSEKIGLLAILVLVASVVFAFLTKKFYISAMVPSEFAQIASEMYSLGIGVLVCAILNIVSAIILLIKNLAK